MSSGFRLCGVSISGVLVRPAGVSAGDFAGYCEAVESAVCEEARLDTPFKPIMWSGSLWSF